MAQIPEKFRKLLVKKVTFDFREACAIEEVNAPELAENEILVQNKYLGINASDKNFSAGRYFPSAEPPFPVGFESLGVVVQKGSKVKLQVGQPVAYMGFGSFTEYMQVEESKAIPIPELNKEFLPLLVSGLTAGIALEQTAAIKKGDTVVVTAAAGGTGQFAVQLAKIAGCHVIGTCSTETKVELLKELGCDRVVNYKEEKLGDVLSKEYPNGVDVVYESVGGEMFDTCVNNLARNGKVVVIGFISGYETETSVPPSETLATLPRTLLEKNASIRGFFLICHEEHVQAKLEELIKLYATKQLKSQVDNGVHSDKGPFKGLESIFDAVDYLYTKKSIGKIVVEL